MSVEELREEACDCLLEIVNKGMDPLDKTKLVESLSRVLQSAGFFNVEQVRPPPAPPPPFPPSCLHSPFLLYLFHLSSLFILHLSLLFQPLYFQPLL